MYRVYKSGSTEQCYFCEHLGYTNMDIIPLDKITESGYSNYAKPRISRHPWHPIKGNKHASFL